jgi:microcystin-dependent protein
VSQNTALFSLIGTTYGGDGRTTTALPNLQGRVPMHPGRGPGLTSRRLGQRGGSETVTLSEAQMPSHTHTAHASEDNAVFNDPNGRVMARGATRLSAFYNNSGTTVAMNSNTLTNTGGSEAHNNLQPFIAINFIIALQGLYPSRG